jgi:prephenate dehydratase
VTDVVAYQGIAGANSELAVKQHFGDSVESHPCETFDELLAVLHRGDVRYALLPVENSFAGAVHGAYELLMDYDFQIQAEIVYHVHHALLLPEDMTINDITTVHSHPQALAQSSRFIRRHNLTPINWFDTAGAAHDLSTQKLQNTAVIASKRAAELYNLTIFAEEIEDDAYNFTRFFLLGNEEPERGEYNKTSLVFATRNRPSALYECLGEFARHNINLTKLESRPRRNRPWEPVFFVDFEGHWQDPACQEALTRLLQKASFVKMLGSYPAVTNSSVGL